MWWLLVRIKFVSFPLIVYHYLKRMFGYLCIFCAILIAIPVTIIPSLIPLFLSPPAWSGGQELGNGEFFFLMKLLHYLKTLILVSPTMTFNATFAVLSPITNGNNLDFSDLSTLANEVFHELLYN
jgi:hypothetical protein